MGGVGTESFRDLIEVAVDPDMPPGRIELRAARTDPIRELLALVSQWMAADIRQPYYPLAGKLGIFPGCPLTVEGYVRADGIEASAGTPARSVRSALLARAEDGLDAMEAAGWHLTRYPAMEFSGNVDPFSQTRAGELVEPSRQYRIGLRVRFETDRPG